MPEDAGGLHRHVGAALRLELVAQRQQVRSHRAEGAHVLVQAPVLAGSKNAGDDSFLMHIRAGTAVIQRVHRFLLSDSPLERLKKILGYVLSLIGRRQSAAKLSSSTTGTVYLFSERPLCISSSRNCLKRGERITPCP